MYMYRMQMAKSWIAKHEFFGLLYNKTESIVSANRGKMVMKVYSLKNS